MRRVSLSAVMIFRDAAHFRQFYQNWNGRCGDHKLLDFFCKKSYKVYFCDPVMVRPYLFGLPEFSTWKTFCFWRLKRASFLIFGSQSAHARLLCLCQNRSTTTYLLAPWHRVSHLPAPYGIFSSTPTSRKKSGRCCVNASFVF